MARNGGERTAGVLAQQLGAALVARWYGDERGHPRLRMRHAPYAVDDDARDRWVQHMRTALDETMVEQDLDPAWEQQLWRYLVGAAIAMVNTDTPSAGHDPAPGPTLGTSSA